jgi:hypothetical protein
MCTCAGPGEDNAAAEDLPRGRTGAPVEAASGVEAATGAAAAADYP